MKKRINITLEDEVIRRVDHYADEHYTSRSGAITMLIVEATDKPSGSVKKENKEIP
ncbi:MAG: type II toxin-antitoxin system HicB family antitoxin [Eubacterium sp.]|nr:type II toxin-antitoxin system HicB family antitoxin [Eubacterium sp.]